MKGISVIKAIYALSNEFDTENEKITGKSMRWSKQEIKAYRELTEITKQLPEDLKLRLEELIPELLEYFQQDGFAAGFRWGSLLMTELLLEN